MDSIKNSIAAFPPKSGKEDEDSLAKVTRFAKITQDLQHQVEHLQAQKMLTTPLEVLEERKRAVSEAAEKIKGGEALWEKATDVVVNIWETLLEDETTKKIRQSV